MTSAECFRPLDYPRERKVEYNPQKAGAEIVESFDLGKIINYTIKESDSPYPDESQRIQISEFENDFYVIFNKKIFIIDKETMTKKREIPLDLKIDYGKEPFLSNKNLHFISNRDILVHDNIILFIYYFGGYYTSDNKLEQSYLLLSIDNSGDNLKFVDVSSDFGLVKVSNYLGYNLKNHDIWIQGKDNLNIEYAKVYRYQYNISDKKYSKNSTLDTWRDYNYCIYGNIMTYILVPLDPAGIIEVNIKQSDIDIQKNLRKIVVDYLGTIFIPHDVHDDGEFLWIAVEKDGKMQLLKLKPI